MRPGRGRKRGGRESHVLRPMMTGQPMVVLLEVREVFRQMPGQGMLSLPMTPLRARANMRCSCMGDNRQV
jgi:hypothetical protein